MSDQALTIKELHDIAYKYFGGDLLHIEIMNIGVRFVCADRKDGNKEYSSVLQCSLSDLNQSGIRGFLDAETREENISK